MIVRAPATSANIGAGFDTAAVAFELWNELEVTNGDGRRRSRARAPGSFRRTPATSPYVHTRCSPTRRESDSASSTGSRSSAGSARRRPRSRSASSRPHRRASAEELLAVGVDARSRTPTTSPPRSSAGSRSRGTGGSPGSPSALPLDAVAVVPRERTSTESSRRTLPATVPHDEAAASAAARRCSVRARRAATPALLRRARRLAARAVPSVATCSPRSAPTPPAGCPRRDAVGLRADRDRLGHGPSCAARPTFGLASPTTRSSSSTSHPGRAVSVVLVDVPAAEGLRAGHLPGRRPPRPRDRPLARSARSGRRRAPPASRRR